MINDLLKELGLSEYEIKIYLSLLALGSSVAGKVAEKAKVNRRNVYDALNRLAKRGFVSYSIKNNRKYYTSVNPKKILQLYEEKIDIVKNLLPELLEKHKKTEKKREVHVFEGKEGIKALFTFDEEKTIYVIGATGLALKRMPVFFTQMFRKKRAKNVKLKQLWNYDAVNIQKYKKLLNSEDRILPKNFKTSTQIFICGNKSVILIWSSSPIAILIIDKEISDGFKKYFYFLWSISK